jgi:hypothetical protein
MAQTYLINCKDILWLLLRTTNQPEAPGNYQEGSPKSTMERAESIKKQTKHYRILKNKDGKQRGLYNHEISQSVNAFFQNHGILHLWKTLVAQSK